MNKTFNIGIRKIDKIKSYERNPRINDGAVEAVAASLKEFGFRQPLVLDENGIITCNPTGWKATKELRIDRVHMHSIVRF